MDCGVGEIHSCLQNCEETPHQGWGVQTIIFLITASQFLVLMWASCGNFVSPISIQICSWSTVKFTFVKICNSLDEKAQAPLSGIVMMFAVKVVKQGHDDFLVKG